MIENTIKINITVEDHSKEALEALENAIDRGLQAIGEKAVYYAADTINKAGRVDTGLLMNSIDFKQGENFTVIGTDVPYAIWHEVGTGIYASDGTGRKSPWAYQDKNGVWHQTRGVKPLHFLKKAATEHSDEYKSIIKNSLENA